MKLEKRNKIINYSFFLIVILAISFWQISQHWDDLMSLVDDVLKESPEQVDTTRQVVTTTGNDPKTTEEHHQPNVSKNASKKMAQQDKLMTRKFRISKQSAKLMGLRTEKVITREEKFTLRFTGKLDYNLDKLSYITPKQKGIVKDIYKTIGDYVYPDESLLRLESIQLGRAQQDYLNSQALLREAKKNYRRVKILFDKRIISENLYLKEASNYRVHKNHVLNAENELRLLGYTNAYILESYSGINPFINLKSPIEGRIIKRYANLGEMITPMKPAYKIADLSILWLHLDIYEKDFRYFKVGQNITFTPISYPDKVFQGTIDYLNSEVMGKSRTIKVRAYVNNKNWKLLPNMYINGSIKAGSNKKTLAIPSSAIIVTGKRKVVFVDIGKGKYEPREVHLGKRIGDYYIVNKGVKEGDSIVVSANFLLDSESQFKGYIKDMEGGAPSSLHQH